MTPFGDLVSAARSRALAYDEARTAMAAMAEGVPSAAEIEDLLVAPSMSIAQASAETMRGLVDEVRSRAVPIFSGGTPAGGLGDTCGTGGGFGTFNVSTVAALLAAALGCPIAKHGNRAVGSRAGSADLLEALGIPVEAPPEAVERSIERNRFGFLFAPKFHRAFAHVMPVRRALAERGVRTVFNGIGPLANPAPVDRQVVGVFDAALVPRAAEVLARSGVRRAYVVHGRVEATGDAAGRAEPLDEISTLGPTTIVEIRDGRASAPRTTSPEDLGLSRAAPEAVRGGDAQENAARARAILSGADDPAGREIVAATAGAVLSLFDRAKDLGEGIARAREALARGEAKGFLASLASR